MSRLLDASVETSNCSGGYLDQVWCELRQPSWLAAVGLPLVATLAGLYVAYRLVRRQLRHDREMRTADRRSAVVNGFGQQALSAYRSLDAMNDDEWWRKRHWPNARGVSDAYRSACVALGVASPFPELMALHQDVEWIWDACAARRKTQEKNGPTISASHNRRAMQAVLEPYIGPCRSAAEAMVSWEGYTSLADPRPVELRHAPFRAAQLEQWKGRYAEQYEGHLRSLDEEEQQTQQG